MKKEFDIGDELWFIDQYGNLCRGIVETGHIGTNWR